MYLRLPENAIAWYGRGDHLSRNNYMVERSTIQQKRVEPIVSRVVDLCQDNTNNTLINVCRTSGKPFWRVKNSHTLDCCPSFFWEAK